MKLHTNDFKEKIKTFGREIDTKITMKIGMIETVLGSEELNAVTPSFQGNILKSVMKQLEIDSNIILPLGVTLKCEFGVKINEEYEYVDFGNYIVKEVERQEDMNSYKIICYDKMLLSMREYYALPISYPITIRSYIDSLCTALGIKFANKEDIFANYDKEIPNELYLDEEGKSLGYTFRDIFDELAQATGSTICINENDELEIRYINETNDTIDGEYLKNINVNFGEKYGPVNSIVLSRSAESDNVYLQDEESVATNGLTELKIIDNQIMNFNNRSEYLPALLEKLNGLEYYINDFASTGIVYYDLCDKYNIDIEGNVYPCIMFNNEILITQGLEENVYTEPPEETETDYKKSDKTDMKINQAYIIVNKQNQTIENLTQKVNENTDEINSVKIIQDSQQVSIGILSTNIDENGNITKVKTKKGFTFDDNGLNIYTDENTYNTQIDNTGTFYKDGDTTISKTTKDGSTLVNLSKEGQEKYSYNEKDYDFIAERIYTDGEYGYAHFYNGDD